MEVLQNGLRKQAVEIIKTAAAGDLVKAKALTKAYLQAIFREQNNAEEAIKSVRELLSGAQPTDHAPLRRREAAEYLGISMDTQMCIRDRGVSASPPPTAALPV